MKGPRNTAALYMASRVLSIDQATLVELNDLKRIVSADRVGSIATRLFADGWAALAAGQATSDVAWWVSGRALAATRLGDLDRVVLSNAGLSPAEVSSILQGAVDVVVPSFASSIKPHLRAGAVSTLCVDAAYKLAFVESLARQPRAGITCPGKPRILLEPSESHAEHCLMVAVYGVLLAPLYDASPARVFLAAMAHHFHNAGMPDSGFTGELLLGRHLDTLMAHYTATCLQQLPPSLRDAVVAARAILPNADTADGRAFHAADVLDRVLQTLQYTRAGTLTTEQMLGEMELVHAGPVKTFQDEVLRQAGLL